MTLKTTLTNTAAALALVLPAALHAQEQATDMTQTEATQENAQAADMTQGGDAQQDAQASGQTGDAMPMDDSATAQSGMTADTDQATADATDYTEEELRPFVEAALAVSALRQTYAVRLQAEGNEEARQALVEQATAEMRSAVEQTEGIDLETYREIGEAASQDDALNQRILEMAQTMIPGEGMGMPQQDEG